MHLEVLDSDRISLLEKITYAMDFQYYMAGGTGLALQIGTRQSVDFDFFVPEHFSSQMIIDKLHDISAHVCILQNTDDTCDLSVNDVQVSFFYYPKQMVSPFVNGEEFPKLNIASVLDIGAMKLAAIGGRGAKKDFFDLYCRLFMHTCG
jgi:predicted nucleotidyltransferase component of viral defense system